MRGGGILTSSGREQGSNTLSIAGEFLEVNGVGSAEIEVNSISLKSVSFP